MNEMGRGGVRTMDALIRRVNEPNNATAPAAEAQGMAAETPGGNGGSLNNGTNGENGGDGMNGSANTGTTNTGGGNANTGTAANAAGANGIEDFVFVPTDQNITDGNGNTYKSHADYVAATHYGRPMDAAAMERERKRQKREMLFSTIGDGLSALSNLWFTTQGAPSMYDPTKGMTAASKARWDKIKESREKNTQEYMKDLLAAQAADADWRQKDYANQLAVWKARTKNSREGKVADSQVALNNARTTTEGLKQTGQGELNRKYTADADKAETEAGVAKKYAEPMAEANLQKTHAQTSQALSSAANNYDQMRKRVSKMTIEQQSNYIKKWIDKGNTLPARWNKNGWVEDGVDLGEVVGWIMAKEGQ